MMLYILPVLSFTAWGMIEVMVLLNPSDTIPVSAFGGIGWIMFAISLSASFILPFVTAKQSGKTRFIISFICQFIVMISLTIVFGIFFHRDFYSYATQLILLSFLLVILKLDTVFIVRNRTAVFKVITLACLVLFLTWIIWLIAMAYAIVTRSDPRWIEATGYNLVNGLIGLMMLAVAGYVWNKARKRLHFSGEGLYLDDRNISGMLSPQENRLIAAFLLADESSLTCRDLYSELKGSCDEDFKEKTTAEPECRRCLYENWTVTACSNYRNYKNRIKDSKKYLELLQIGTIVPVSENPREIKEKGWRLRLFDDVHFQSTKS